MPNMSSITIAGHLARDAKTKELPGTTVTQWSMAVNHKRKGEQSVMWFNVSLWGSRGQALEPYLTKGTAVLVIGGFNVREYEGKTGNAYSLDVNAQDVSLLGGGGGEAKGSASPRSAAPADADDDPIPF